jgi:hypothetical protein
MYVQRMVKTPGGKERGNDSIPHFIRFCRDGKSVDGLEAQHIGLSSGEF